MVRKTARSLEPLWRPPARSTARSPGIRKARYPRADFDNHRIGPSGCAKETYSQIARDATRRFHTARRARTACPHRSRLLLGGRHRRKHRTRVVGHARTWLLLQRALEVPDSGVTIVQLR